MDDATVRHVKLRTHDDNDNEKTIMRLLTSSGGYLERNRIRRLDIF